MACRFYCVGLRSLSLLPAFGLPGITPRFLWTLWVNIWRADHSRWRWIIDLQFCLLLSLQHAQHALRHGVVNSNGLRAHARAALVSRSLSFSLLLFFCVRLNWVNKCGYTLERLVSFSLLTHAAAGVVSVRMLARSFGVLGRAFSHHTTRARRLPVNNRDPRIVSAHVPIQSRLDGMPCRMPFNEMVSDDEA